MSWTRDRVLIIASAAIFLFFGGWLLAVPTALEGIGIKLSTAEAVIDVRATYGGLELGLAAFLAVAQARPPWHRAALLPLRCRRALRCVLGRAAGGMAVRPQRHRQCAQLYNRQQSAFYTINCARYSCFCRLKWIESADWVGRC